MQRTARGPLKRMPAQDSVAIREVLAVAWKTIEPDERTQRQLFAALMPELYALRHKGFSFRQIASLLNDSGCSLQPGTVRGYYNELIEGRMEECKKRFDEQMALLHNAQQMSQSKTQSKDVGHLAEKIIAMRQRNQELVDQRVKAVLSIPNLNDQSGDQASAPQSTSSNPRPAAKNEAPSAPKEQPSALGKAAEIGYGLTDVSRETATGAAGNFFDGISASADPQVPQAESPAPAVNTSSRAKTKSPPNSTAAKLRCCLPSAKVSPPPLERRPGVPEEVYGEGLLEHPAIPGLMLTKDERLYGALLEYTNPEDGEVHVETGNEKRFRIKWVRPVQPAGSTENFVQLHQSTLPPKG